MPVILGFFALLATAMFFVLRAHGTVKAVKELDRDTKGLQRRAGGIVESLIGTPLARVRDPRLAACILMIQLVRSGSPVTAQEKTAIMEQMEGSLGIQNVSAMFEQAWGYTTPRTFFSNVSDQLLPLLRERLDQGERMQLVDMLGKVAGAYGEPGELQLEGIARLKRRLAQL